jgi:Sulfotransferase domain
MFPSSQLYSPHNNTKIISNQSNLGQYSLKLALDDLGFPALHTQHLYEHQEIIDMWTNEIFLPSIRSKTSSMGKPNFQLIADHGFTATADLPMALYFEDILHEFPDCKFILTTRENSDVWFRSWDTLTRSITEPTNLGGFFFSNVRRYSYYLRWLFSVVNKDDSYLTIPFPLPHQNKQVAVASYEAHNRRVREIIPPHQLLEYNVKQGWEPLCNFLEITNCPTTPFPKTNSATSVQVQALSAFFVPVIVSLFVLFYGFAQAFRRFTGMTVVQWVNWKNRELNMTLRKVMLGEKIDCMYSAVEKKV